MKLGRMRLDIQPEKSFAQLAFVGHRLLIVQYSLGRVKWFTL